MRSGQGSQGVFVRKAPTYEGMQTRLPDPFPSGFPLLANGKLSDPASSNSTQRKRRRTSRTSTQSTSRADHQQQHHGSQSPGVDHADFSVRTAPAPHNSFTMQVDDPESGAGNGQAPPISGTTSFRPIHSDPHLPGPLPHHVENAVSPSRLGVDQPSVTGFSHAPDFILPDGLCERGQAGTAPVGLSLIRLTIHPVSPPSAEDGQPRDDQLGPARPAESGAGSDQAPPGGTTSFQPINRCDGPGLSSCPTDRRKEGADAAGEFCQSTQGGVSAALEGIPLNVLPEVAGWGDAERPSAAVVPTRGPTERTSSNRGSPPNESDSGGAPGRLNDEDPWDKSRRRTSPPPGSPIHGLLPHVEIAASTPQLDPPASWWVESAGQLSVNRHDDASGLATIPHGSCEEGQAGTEPAGLSSDAAVGSPAPQASPSAGNEMHQPTTTWGASEQEAPVLTFVAVEQASIPTGNDERRITSVDEALWYSTYDVGDDERRITSLDEALIYPADDIDFNLDLCFIP